MRPLAHNDSKLYAGEQAQLARMHVTAVAGAPDATAAATLPTSGVWHTVWVVPSTFCSNLKTTPQACH